MLSQVQDGKEHVIVYASHSLHPAERNDANYSSFKLELLALKWAVTDKFKDFLWGAQFTVFTDNNPLVHLKTGSCGATLGVDWSGDPQKWTVLQRKDSVLDRV